MMRSRVQPPFILGVSEIAIEMIQKWIGTKDAPCLTGYLHDAVTVGTGDEGLRQQIAAITTASRLAIELMAIFKAAPKRTEPLLFAWLAAREFLLGLSAALAVSHANKLEKLAEDERKVLWQETLSLIDDDNSAANTSTAFLKWNPQHTHTSIIHVL
jgi:hypothetical protein